MPLFLSQRAEDLKERMDNPDCDPNELNKTYRQFRHVNSLISRWESIYRNWIRPRCKEAGTSCSLLDIGFGGGDIPIRLKHWAEGDNIPLQVTAIDTDKRALKFVEQAYKGRNHKVDFRLASSTELLQAGEQYDFVISNHLLHHLDRNEFENLLDEASKLSTGAVLFNDIERGDLAYFFFQLIARPWFRSSFIVEDGLTSIKRSYTLKELRDAAPAVWEVRRLFPYRLLLYYLHE